jgi:hypothetical protein
MNVPSDYHWKHDPKEDNESRQLHAKFGRARQVDQMDPELDMCFTFGVLNRALSYHSLFPEGYRIDDETRFPPVSEFLSCNNSKIENFLKHFIEGKQKEPIPASGVIEVKFKILNMYWKNTDMITKENAILFLQRSLFGGVAYKGGKLVFWQYGMRFALKIDPSEGAGDIDYDNLELDKSTLQYDEINLLHGEIKIKVPFNSVIYTHESYDDVAPTMSENRLERRYKNLRPMSCEGYAGAKAGMAERLSLTKDTLKSVLDYRKYPTKVAFVVHDKGVCAGLTSMDIDTQPLKKALDKQFSYIRFMDKINPFGFLFALLHMYGDPEKFGKMGQGINVNDTGAYLARSHRIEQYSPCNYYANTTISVNNEAYGMVRNRDPKTGEFTIDMGLFMESINQSISTLDEMRDLFAGLKEFVEANKEKLTGNLKEFAKEFIINSIKDDPARFAALDENKLSYDEKPLFFKDYARTLVSKVDNNSVDFDIEEEEE